MTAQVILKFGISAAIVVAVSELSKRSSLLGGLLASLPLTSLLAILWLWRDTHDTEKVTGLATSIFWLVVPSLLFFIAFPLLLKRHMTFWPALGLSVVVMLAGYGLMGTGLRALGIKL